MPNAPKTPTRPMRIPADEWADYGAAAEQAGSNRTRVTRDFISWYTRQPGAKMPKRPNPEELTP